VAALLARHPHPVLAPGLSQLQEAAAAAAAWRTKYYTAIGLPGAAAAAAAGVSIAAAAAQQPGSRATPPAAAGGAGAGAGGDDAAAAAAAADVASPPAAPARTPPAGRLSKSAEAAAAAAAAAAAKRVSTRATAIAAMEASFAGWSGQHLLLPQHSSGALAAAGEEPAAAPAAAVVAAASSITALEQMSAATAAAAAAAVAAFAGKHFDVARLTQLAAEAGDVGLELPEQQLLQQRLADGAALQDHIAHVLAAAGDDRADLHGLKQLQVQANSCGLALTGLDALASTIAAGEALQQRLRAALQQRSSLEQLRSLADEAAQLPVYVGDVEAVHSLLGKARDWERKAEAVMAQVGVRVRVRVRVCARVRGRARVCGCLVCALNGLSH
jgi:hypothetical protein